MHQTPQERAANRTRVALWTILADRYGRDTGATDVWLAGAAPAMVAEIESVLEVTAGSLGTDRMQRAYRRTRAHKARFWRRGEPT